MKRIYVYANSQHPCFILFNLLERSLFCHVHAFNSQHHLFIIVLEDEDEDEETRVYSH